MAGRRYRVEAARPTRRKPVGTAAGGAATAPLPLSLDAGAVSPVRGRALVSDEVSGVKEAPVSNVVGPEEPTDVVSTGVVVVVVDVGVVVVVVVGGAGSEWTAAVMSALAAV
jgi:hypothetical protein